ncbi:MAG: META domain-containing protein [Saprospiraceae bacterium]|nr:META domain-containing protein [Saprospiraceae bacterium]
MRYFKPFCLLILLISGFSAKAQRLEPGFDPSEYTEMMRISARFGDSSYYSQVPAPAIFRPVYRSAVMGLDNCWDLWTDDNKRAVISLRGTTVNSDSWLANMYAAMVPAKGTLNMNGNKKFNYHLADNPAAAVHVGWLLSTAFLTDDILPKIDSLYRIGTKNIYIVGHSQGGAIAYLLTAHLYNLQNKGRIPQDVRFKTYCSAGPKPGNLYFAYEYEAMTQGGWAYNVVNTADWVPEVPLSVQTLDDFNKTNPFVYAKEYIKTQKFPNNLALKYVYKQLDKPSRTAQKRYQKYLGDLTEKSVQKYLPEYTAPEYTNSSNYVRTGNTIILLADEAYYKVYPDVPEKVFQHHFHMPYLYLLERQLPAYASSSTQKVQLDGTWEVMSITGQEKNFDMLYHVKKPIIAFDQASRKCHGNSSCNGFSTTLLVDGAELKISPAMAMTKMACEGNGEEVFVNALKKVTTFSFLDQGKKLQLRSADAVIMVLERRK